MIQILINNAGFTADFGRTIATAKNPRAVLAASGRELATQLKNWFRNKDRTEPNPLSSRRTHFWQAVMRSVSQPQLAGYNSISVSITDARFAQKVYGGRITAKLAGALTIPVEERAYGRTAGTFEQETGLKLILIKSGKGSFQKAVLAVKEGKGLTVEYILKPSVMQKPDPTALPPETLLEQAILARAQKALDTTLKLK
jgi:hypothetical protein